MHLDIGFTANSECGSYPVGLHRTGPCYCLTDLSENGLTEVQDLLLLS